MNLAEAISSLEAASESARALLASVSNLAGVEEIERDVLGKRSVLVSVNEAIKDFAAEDRPAAGKAIGASGDIKPAGSPRGFGPNAPRQPIASLGRRITSRARPPVPARIARGYCQLVIPRAKGNTPADRAGTIGERRAPITSRQTATSRAKARGP